VERAPGTYWIRGSVGPRAGLDAAEKRKIPSPRRELKLPNPDRPEKNKFVCSSPIGEEAAWTPEPV